MEYKSKEIETRFLFEFKEDELKKIQAQIQELYNIHVGQDVFIKVCPDLWDFGFEIEKSFGDA